MNAQHFNPLTSAYSVKYTGLRDEEKERIMDKVYESDVFKEFILQWGNAMPPLHNEQQKKES